ncbi:hypothetical protein E2C01_058300 [Portunus trituberculatus]|uniref:Uncharacterized protein n=1 Tax=Portunus trituberculatus TaxID=210409 RepID=A0A5B7H4Y8_PORTR|nr:hypothetical protein [Portunus trituberculatus]
MLRHNINCKDLHIYDEEILNHTGKKHDSRRQDLQRRARPVLFPVAQTCSTDLAAVVLRHDVCWAGRGHVIVQWSQNDGKFDDEKRINRKKNIRRKGQPRATQY